MKNDEILSKIHKECVDIMNSSIRLMFLPAKSGIIDCIAIKKFIERVQGHEDITVLSITHEADCIVFWVGCSGNLDTIIEKLREYEIPLIMDSDLDSYLNKLVESNSIQVEMIEILTD